MLKYLLLSILPLSTPLSSTPTEFEFKKEPSGIPYSWHLPQSRAELYTWSKIAAYRLASYLTDPLCKAREYTVRYQILEDLPPSPYIKNQIEAICSFVRKRQLIDESWLDPDQVSFFIEKCFLIGGTATLSALAPITGLSGMGLRCAASNLESESFIHYTGSNSEKDLDSESFTHMQWNICGVKGGYDIEEGGQMPIRDDLLSFSENRIFKIAEKIRRENPDVLSLNEVFDINDAVYLVDALKDLYAHFVIQCGSRTQGLNSGLFFATKFGVKEISFTPFPKDTLVDRSKYSEKGFLVVSTYDKKGSIAIFISSHLQHSDEPEFPTEEEIRGRALQIDLILQKVNSYEQENVVVAGDLNLEDQEFSKISPEFYSRFRKIISYNSAENEEQKTWLGDFWYVAYGNKETTFSPFASKAREEKRKQSGGLNLDHVLVKIKSKEDDFPKISTVLKTTGYDPYKISRNSLSDHMILLSTITLQR